MERTFCEFCEKEFANKSNLKKHLNNSKSCLEIRLETSGEYKCKHCYKNYSSAYNLERHYKSCKSLYSMDKLQKEMEELKTENLFLKSENKSQLEKITLLNKLYNKMENEYFKLQQDYKSLVENNNKTIEKVSLKAIENSGTKNTYNNNSKNFYQQLLPLTNEYLNEQSKNLQLKHVVCGAESLAYFAKEYSLKDRVICTDVARKNFVFKDETNNIIKDPKGVKITKKFIDSNKTELVRLLTEYALLYYSDDCPYEYKDKVEIDECLYAVQKGDIPSNADNYLKFERQFTSCFSKLVYNKNFKEDHSPLQEDHSPLEEGQEHLNEEINN